MDGRSIRGGGDGFFVAESEGDLDWTASRYSIPSLADQVRNITEPCQLVGEDGTGSRTSPEPCLFESPSRISGFPSCLPSARRGTNVCNNVSLPKGSKAFLTGYG